MKYNDAAAFRMALEQVLSNQATATGTNLMRLRKRVVFERLLVRIVTNSDVGWVVKGGMALEIRDPDRSRMTRDLDMSIGEVIETGEQAGSEIANAIAVDPHGDFFEFRIIRFSDLSIDAAGQPGWRFTIEASLAGRAFEQIIVDVMVRPNEQGMAERVSLPDMLAFAEVPTIGVPTISRERHFAEKLHAFTSRYGTRPNSRVKDLPDMLLLIDEGLEPSARLHTTVGEVFAERGSHELPAELPDPPAGWDELYTDLANELRLDEETIAEAMETLRVFWDKTRGHSS